MLLKSSTQCFFYQLTLHSPHHYKPSVVSLQHLSKFNIRQVSFFKLVDQQLFDLQKVTSQTYQTTEKFNVAHRKTLSVQIKEK